MGILNILSVSAPGGIWGNLINWLLGSISNYAVVLIVLTILVRAALLPLDIVNKYTSRANSRKMAEIKPDLDKVQKQYANNKEMLNKKTMEVYRKHNYNIMGTCGVLLVYMILTMVIFFSLFSALNKMSAYKIYNQYQELCTTYAQELGLSADASNTDIVEAATITEYTTDEQKQIIAHANEAVVNKYNDTKESFLWIKNIWRPDSSAKPVLEYSTFVTSSRLSNEEKNVKNAEACYNIVMNPIKEANKGWNGYFILALVAAATTLASFYVNNLVSKVRAKIKGKTFIKDASQSKTMLIIMPVIMGIFTLFYNAAFGLYIVTGNLFALVTGPLITLLIEVIDEHKQNKISKSTPRATYSRK